MKNAYFATLDSFDTFLKLLFIIILLAYNMIFFFETFNDLFKI